LPWTRPNGTGCATNGKKEDGKIFLQSKTTRRGWVGRTANDKRETDLTRGGARINRQKVKKKEMWGVQKGEGRRRTLGFDTRKKSANTGREGVWGGWPSEKGKGGPKCGKEVGFRTKGV